MIESFLLDPSQANIDIEVKTVAIEDLRQPPLRGRVEFYKIFTSPFDHTEQKREFWTANVVYTFRDQVRNEDAARQSAGTDHHLFPRGSGLSWSSSMIRILIYNSWFAWRPGSSPSRVVAELCPAVPPTHSVPAHVTSTLFHLSSGTANGISGCARRHGGLLLFPDSSPKASVGPLPQKQPWALGSSHPCVRPG